MTKQIKLDENGSDTQEWVKQYNDLLGRSYKTLHADGAFSARYFNSSGQLWKSVDPDGVTSLIQYTDAGEREYTVIDMDQDDTVDLDGTDRITRTVSDVVVAHGVDVARTRTYVWPDSGVDSSLLVSTSERAVTGTDSWQTAFGLERHSFTDISASTQTVTSTNTAPDGSYTVSVSTGGLTLSSTSYDANDAQLTGVTFAYDEFNRRTTSTDARNGATAFAFNSAGQTTSLTTPAPAVGVAALVTSYQFDDMGRVWRTVLPDGAAATNEFHLNGQLKKTYGARNYPVEYTYDSAGRMKTLKTWKDFHENSGTAVTTWNYDSERGWLTNKQYDDGQGPSYGYTDAGRLETRTWVRTAGGQPLTTTYGYDNAGAQTSVDYSDSTADVATVYDRRGRATQITDAGGVRAQDFHDSGQLLGVEYTSGILDGIVITNTFDNLLRRTNLTALNSQLSTTLNSVAYSHDSASRLATVSDGTNSAAYAYLANSRMVESITFKQNAATRMTTTKSYDKVNRLTAITHQDSQPSTLSSFNYSYNSAGQRTRVDHADDSYWLYEYDALGQVKSGKKYWSDNTPVPGMQFEYGFDDIGNRRTASAGGDGAGQNLRKQSYAANALNQYTSRTVPGFIDVLGTADSDATVTVNNVATTRTSDFFRAELSVDNSTAPVYLSLTNLAILGDSPNADITTNKIADTFLPPALETFAYDDDGNLLSDGRWTNTWNGENRLIQLETTAAAVTAGAPQQKLDFAYDSQGRRVEKRLSEWNGSSWDGQYTNRFLYDGWNLIAETDAAGTLLRSYVWGLDLSGSEQGAGGVGGLLMVSDTATHFAGHDGNGNVMLLASADTATITAQYEYSPFGKVIRASGTMADANPIRFSGKYEDSETGYNYYGLRFYNPDNGRWLNRDPIREWGGLNVYGFVGNRPTTHVDYLGFFGTPYGEFVVEWKYVNYQNDTLKGFHVNYNLDPKTPCPCKDKSRIYLVQAVDDPLNSPKIDALPNEVKKNKDTPGGVPPAAYPNQDPWWFKDAPLIQNSEDNNGTWKFEVCAVCRFYPTLSATTPWIDRILGCVTFKFVRHNVGQAKIEINGKTLTGTGQKETVKAAGVGSLYNAGLQKWKDEAGANVP